ncbi:MAG: hypothetical protein WBB33_03955 [Candidatus Saccharimonadales bacterium]
MEGKTIMTTIPTIDDALRAVADIEQKATDDAAEKARQLLQRRAELFGRVIQAAQNVMEVYDIDDIPRLEAALAALRGDTVQTKPQINLTDDQEQLLKDFANGNVRLETAKVTNPDGTVTVLSCWADRRVPAVRRASKPTAAPTTKDDVSSPTTGKDAKSSVPTPKDVATKPKSKSAPAPKPEPDEDTTDDPAPAGDSAPKPEPASVTAEPVKPSLRDKLKATSAKVLDAVTEKPDAKPTHK